jgi:hypothetical protein
MHRQTNRYRAGGDPREICNHQTPSREARVLTFSGSR